jgi:tricorn protease
VRQRPDFLGFGMTISRLVAALLLTTPLAAHAALPRFPQPYGDRIVFVADGNIWSVAKTGGAAERLTSAAGQDMFPRVSPDGKWIAYTEATRAGTDVWVIPAWGGAARRLTYHPTTEAGTGGRHGPDNMVVTWTPDSQNVVYLSKGDQWNSWIQYMYKVPVMGGAPVAMWAWRPLGPTATPSPTTASSGTSAPGSATTAGWRSRSSPTTSTPRR